MSLATIGVRAAIASSRMTPKLSWPVLGAQYTSTLRSMRALSALADLAEQVDPVARALRGTPDEEVLGLAPAGHEQAKLRPLRQQAAPAPPTSTSMPLRGSS